MNTPACHQCGEAFTAVRSDAKFCATKCRMAASRKANPEPPENRTTSHSKRRREDELLDLHMLLCENYYGMKPADRPEYLEGLIDRAAGGDTKVRQVLTNVYLLRASQPKRSTNYRASRAYPTLAQEAHRFTSATWGVSIKDACAG